MLKAQGRGRHAEAAFFLSYECVTDIAIPAYHFSFRTHVLAVVAAETAVEIEMAEIVGMRLPVQLHLRECCSAEDLLDFVNCVTNFKLLSLRHLGVLAF